MKMKIAFLSVLFANLIMSCTSQIEKEKQEDMAFVDSLLNKMTLAEKVGQMTQIDHRFMHEIDDISKFHLGSLLAGGGGGPKPNTAESWINMYDSYQEEALKSRLGIPLLFGIDAVHGHNNLVGATIFPHNIGLGATRDSDLVERVSKATALEVAATGIDWNFAPCVAVPRDIRWGRTYEGFSEDPEVVKALGRAAVIGYQSTQLDNPNHVLACAKHFIGDGGTTMYTGDNNWLIDRGDTQIDEEALRRIHLPSFLEAIDAGVATIMASFNSWNGVKVHGSKYLLTDLLKTELGFEGFVISDWAGIDEIPGDYKSDIITSINAGVDMVMVPGAVIWGFQPFENFVSLLIESVEEGSIPQSRIDDAVRRILLVKKQYGLWERPFTDRSLKGHIGSQKHREIAREAVAKSQVLLKNDGVLPLKKSGQKIIVAGRGAKDIGMQCGGWTIEWQGELGEVTVGTTMLSAIKSTVDNPNLVHYSPDGTDGDGDVAVIFVGEDPYAEGEGDRENLELSKDDLTVIQNIQKRNIPIVIVLLTGRPLIITEHVNDWNAVVAAWLPGTEGQGVSDVLFGDYNPTGRLSFSWPKFMNQVPVSPEDDHLFEFGYGLSY